MPRHSLMRRIREHVPREECEHRALAALDEARPTNAAAVATCIWPGHDTNPQAAALAADGILQPMRRRGLVRYCKGGWTKSPRSTPGNPSTETTAKKEHPMSDDRARLHRRWSPHGPRGAAEATEPDTILAGGWLANPVHATREVDLCAAYRALAQEGMADRLVDAGTSDLGASLERHPHVEHLAGARITFSDLGTTVVLGDGKKVPADKRHVHQLCAELTLRKGDDPPRTMRVAADIGFIGDRAEDGFVLGRSTRISAEDAAEAMMDVFGVELEIEAAANCDDDPGRLRDAIEEEAVRILEGNDAATLRRIHNTTRRKIQPIVPTERGAWIEVHADGEIQVGFR